MKLLEPVKLVRLKLVGDLMGELVGSSMRERGGAGGGRRSR